MGIALSEDQLALAESVREFAQDRITTEATRAEFEDAAAGIRPVVWAQLVAQGFPGLHLPEAVGGQGAGIVELAVLLEETGRALTPGPLLPTVLTSLLIGRAGGPTGTDEVLARLAEGGTAACATTVEGLQARPSGTGWEVSGTTEPMLGGLSGELLLLGARVGASTDAPETVWFLVDRAAADGVKVESANGADLTRDIGRVTLVAHAVRADEVLALDLPRVQTVAAVLFAAEAVGLARWCQESGLAYAKVREQFGRTIGSFQAIKHKCARLYGELELMTAAAWDAASALEQEAEQSEFAAAAAAIQCLHGAADLALETVTLFGGIGYTWEHDAHLYWRRAMSLAALIGPRYEWEQRLGQLAGSVQRTRDLDLGIEPVGFRERIGSQLADIAAGPEDGRRLRLAEAGLVSPNYPAPWGIAAGAVEQVIISQEFARAGLSQPSTVIGEWALPTILAHGTDEQRERFVAPTLRGEIDWCQLFSEPGAGSDLASLRTRAVKVDGGWRLDGQKVWTSNAQAADWAICLARTDPDVPKHKGISYFLVDMRSPGLEVRPLREANGGYLFNEVFLDAVFVPDAGLVGAPNEGWRLARTTLGNERLSIGSGMSGPREDPSTIAARLGRTDDAVGRDVGRLTAATNAFEALTQRSVLRRLSGLQPGAEASVIKLVSSWNITALRRAALTWCGSGAAVLEGDDGGPIQALLSVPPMLIGGGTSEIQLNVIGEQVLGLPRG
jgi:alkylation response protein AidB-like acyl-CoA dehydrogenase